MVAVGRTLVGLLRDPTRVPSLEGFSPDEIRRLFDLATWHKVPTALGALQDQLPQQLAADVQRQRFLAGKEQFRVLGDLAAAGRALAAAEVDWAVFKGPTLARLDYGGHLVRRYADVDVLVAPDDVERTVDAIVEAGGRELDRNWPLMQRLRLGQLSIELPHGTPCDLHWDLLHGDGERRAFDYRAADVLETRQHLVVGRQTLPVLEPHDHLIFVAVHAVLAGGARLLWMKDIDVLLAQTKIDVDVLLDRARRASATMPLAVAFDRRQRVLGRSEVEVEIEGGRGWRTLIGTFDRVRRPGYPPVNLLTGTGLVRSTRATTAESMRQLAGEAQRFVRDDLVANKSHPWRRPLRPSAEPTNPLHVPTGGPEARRAFFESVRRWGAA